MKEGEPGVAVIVSFEMEIHGLNSAKKEHVAVIGNREKIGKTVADGFGRKGN